MTRAGAFNAGAMYFLLVFLAGWMLGPIRVLLLAPRFGPTIAVLMEAPLMLAAMIVAARWVIRRRQVPVDPGPRLRMGLAALGLLAVAEIAGAALVRGIPLREYLAGIGTPAGQVALLLFLLFAAMPLLVRG